MDTLPRSILNLIPKNSVLPIVQGKLRGKRWIVGSSTHGCWLGSYEFDKQKAFAQICEPGHVVYDIGANVGFYSLLAAQLIGRDGHVYAFEPLPRNLEYLHRHMTLNHFEKRVTIQDMAISNETCVSHFAEGISHEMGRLSEKGGIEVHVNSLDRLLVELNLRPPDLIKIDVEGGEYEVLLGAEATLRDYSPTLFLATHGHAIHRKCIDYLIDLNYCPQLIDDMIPDEIIARAKIPVRGESR